jgi:predicted Zn finger-like uncharacterized protein
VYLTCPACNTVYAVRAAMLREGQGEVRCGACRTVFNALDHLSDELPQPSAQPQTGVSAADAAPKAVPAATSLAVVPEALREDIERAAEPSQSPASRNLGQWAAALVLIAALAMQYVWFAPRDLVQRFPMVRTAVERFCLEAGCMQRAERAPELIRMVSRDVRAHPRYEGALLVTATFTNAATWPQPFPRLRFSLYDVNGETIAARTFLPREYLAGVLPADAPLPPGQPVQVGLELLAPEEAAVSFEFEFL